MDELLEEALADFDNVPQPPQLPRPSAASSVPSSSGTQRHDAARGTQNLEEEPGPCTSSAGGGEAAAASPGPKGLGAGLGPSLPKRKPVGSAKRAGGDEVAGGAPLSGDAQRLANDLMALIRESGMGGPEAEGDDVGPAGLAEALQGMALQSMTGRAQQAGAAAAAGMAAGTSQQASSLSSLQAAAAAATDRAATAGPHGAQAPGSEADDPFEQLLTRMLQGGGGGGGAAADVPDFGAMLRAAMQEAMQDPSSSGMEGLVGAAGVAAPHPHAAAAAGGPASEGAEEAFSSAALRGLMERTNKTVSKTRKQTRGHVEGPQRAGAAGAGPSSGANPLADLLGSLGGLGAGGGEGQNVPGMDMMVDYIMQNLLSKDVLYGPLKEIRDKYPPWLEARQSQLPAEEFERYVAQYESIRKVCKQYEEAPGDFAKLVELIQEMQTYGDPPGDIVEEVTGGAGRDLGSILGDGPKGGGPDPLDQDVGVPPALAELTKDLDEKCCIQ